MDEHWKPSDDFLHYNLDCDGSSGNLGLEEAFAEVLGEMFDIFKRKQMSYGSKNISAFGLRGIVVRLNDKLQRLIRLTWRDLQNPLEDETLEDTLLDMANYAAIGVLLKEDKWPDA